MGNDKVCKVVGMGFVTLKMEDETKRTLEKVRHILAFKRNFISLGELVIDGYIFKGYGEKLRVSKGSMVCLKGELKNDIYMLKSGGCVPIAVVDEQEHAS